MQCEICGWTLFRSAEYRACRGQTAPAFECTQCGAITLDEAAAQSAKERDSVKTAIAVRAEIIAGRSLPPDEPAR